MTVTAVGDDPNSGNDEELTRGHGDRDVRINLESASTETNYEEEAERVDVIVKTRETFVDSLNPNGTTNNSTIVAGCSQVESHYCPEVTVLPRVIRGSMAALFPGSHPRLEACLSAWLVGIDVDPGATPVKFNVPEGSTNTGEDEMTGDLPNGQGRVNPGCYVRAAAAELGGLGGSALALPMGTARSAVWDQRLIRGADIWAGDWRRSFGPERNMFRAIGNTRRRHKHSPYGCDCWLAYPN